MGWILDILKKEEKMAKRIGEIEPLPPDDPRFKRGLVLVPVRRFAPSRTTSAGDTDGSPMQPVGDAIEAYLQGLRSPSSSEESTPEESSESTTPHDGGATSRTTQS